MKGPAVRLLDLLAVADTKGVSREEMMKELGVTWDEATDLANRAVASDHAWLARGRLFSTAPF